MRHFLFLHLIYNITCIGSIGVERNLQRYKPLLTFSLFKLHSNLQTLFIVYNKLNKFIFSTLHKVRDKVRDKNLLLFSLA